MRKKLANLYGRYAHALRREDIDTLLDCFTDDAVFELQHRGTYRGPDELRELFTGFGRDRPRHLITDLWEGEDGRCEAHFMLLGRRTGVVEAYGHYEDVAVKGDDGQWRWAERKVIFEWRSYMYSEVRRVRPQRA